MWRICHIKGIVHSNIYIWCLSAYPKDIQDVGDFVSSVEHKWRFFTQTVADCQSYNCSQWDPRLWEKKKHTVKTKLNSAGRDDILRSKDTIRSVCARHRTVFIHVFTSDPPHGYRQEPQGLNWFCLCMFFWLSKPWVPLTAIIWLIDCNGLS